jgi:hypothetical protein
MPALSETFSSTDGTVLTSRASDSGHTWAADALSGTGSLEIQGLRGIYVAADNNQNCLIDSSWTPAGADYTVSFDLVFRSEVAQELGMVGRLNSGSVSWVFFEWDWNAGSPVYRLSETVGGVAGASDPQPAPTHAADESVTLAMVFTGTGVIGKVNGVPVCAITTAVTGAGMVAFLCSGGISTSSSGAHFDNVTATEPAGASVALGGTILGATEADLVAGGKTITLTLTGDTFIP